MPICVTALCGRVSVQAQAGFAPAAIIPKEAVPIDPKQERHISMQSAKSPETAATSAQKKNGKKKKNKPRRSIFGTIMRFIGCLLCVCVMAASAGAVLLSLYVVQVTEDPDGKLDLDEQKLKQTSIVYDRDGNEVNTFAGENNRIWREISAMPENLQNAVIAVEDKDLPGFLFHKTMPSFLKVSAKKTGTPRMDTSAPTGVSKGAFIMRAAISDSTSTTPPMSADTGTSLR